MRHLPDREVQTQCQNLFEQFKRSEDQTRTNYDQTSLSNIYDQLYQQHSYEYIPPWNFLDMSSATVAQQLTLVDAVSRSKERRKKQVFPLGIAQTRFTLRMFESISE